MKHLKKSLLISSFLILPYISAHSANMDVNAKLDSSCKVTANNINFGTESQMVGKFILINNNFTLLCSKGLTTKIGFIGEHNENPTSHRRYMIGSNPNNNDKLMFILGTVNTFYTADGNNTHPDYRNYTGTGQTTNFNIFDNFRVGIVGVVINGKIKANPTDLVTADNYSTTIQMILTY
jgi:hypothetical protein